MPQNKIQYQEGMSISEFIDAFGTDEKCELALEQTRWPDGFRCPNCSSEHFGEIHDKRRKRFQCKDCRHQTTVTAGTIFDSTKLRLSIWYQAMFLISTAKNGISAMEMGRSLGVSYPTAWKVKHKLMQVMKERDGIYLLRRTVQVDDAYLGGERSGGKPGRGSENKEPFVAALELNEENKPIFIKLTQVSGFTSEAIHKWTRANIMPGSTVFSDGLGCFRAVAGAECKHVVEVARGRKPKDIPTFQWLNTIIGNVKTSLSGTYHAFNFEKYGNRYLAEIAYRFNRRFDLKNLPQRLLIACVACRPFPEHLLRAAELDC